MKQPTQWDSLVEYWTDQAQAHIDATPEMLLAGDAGGVHPKATPHLCRARLLGFDDQIDHEWWIPVPPTTELLAPMPQRVTLAMAEPDAYPMMRTAKYRLFGVWSEMAVDRSMTVAVDGAPANLPYDQTTFQTRILFVRYRRRA